MFISFDVTSLPCASQQDGDRIRGFVSQYHDHVAQLKDAQGRAVFSTFAGEYCTFGRGNANDGWSYAIKEGLPPTLFLPAYFSDPSSFKNFPVMDGDFFVRNYNLRAGYISNLYH